MSEVVTNAPIDQIPEYAELINGGNLTPLCSLVRNWIYAEYASRDSFVIEMSATSIRILSAGSGDSADWEFAELVNCYENHPNEPAPS